MIELMFLKKSILKESADPKIAIFVNKGLKFQTNVCNGCHDPFF